MRDFIKNLVEFEFKDQIRNLNSTFWSETELFQVKFEIRPSLKDSPAPIKE